MKQPGRPTKWQAPQPKVASAITRNFGYAGAHHLLLEKITPPSLDIFRRELLLPQHRDIFLASQAAATFEEAIGTVAAMLDIALDGTYDPADLFVLLTTALRNRNRSLAATDLAPGLQEVELVERADSITVEFAGVKLETEGAEEQAVQETASAKIFSRFMQDKECKLCENKQACWAAEKCLGEEAYQVEVGEA